MSFAFAAAIFDMDGTVTDNMPFHWEAFELFMQRHGLPPIDEITRALLDGKRNAEIMPVLFRRELGSEEIKGYSDEKEQCYREIAAGRMAPLPGLLPLLDRLDAAGVAVAVATSAPPANVGFTLEALGITERVRLVVRGDEVPNGKPAPDVFLEAARRLGVTPAECVVFEDALAGIEAAHAAGMYCVALATTNSRSQLQAHGLAEAIFADFDEYLATV